MPWPGNTNMTGEPEASAPEAPAPEGPNERDLLTVAPHTFLSDGTKVYFVSGRFISSDEYDARLGEGE